MTEHRSSHSICLKCYRKRHHKTPFHAGTKSPEDCCFCGGPGIGLYYQPNDDDQPTNCCNPEKKT